MRITFSANAEGGWWESRGYSVDSSIPATCRITAPTPSQSIAVGQPLRIHGTALHADQVWVSINASAPLAADLDSAGAGIMHWSIDWIPPFLGDHEVRVWVNNQQAVQMRRVTAV